ncbi:MAG: Fe-S cluster assembly protein SufD, partial [Calditrichia bacterium]|nr:Fe-S cluster assembly protein SufD [Calditrichia bacterium]
LPNKKMEEWRRTDVKKIPFNQFEVGTINPVRCQNPPSPPEEMCKNSILIYSCDGVLQKLEGLEDLKKQGVIISTWEEAVKKHEDLASEILQNPLVRWENGVFEAMNGAFLNMGIVIYVPKNVRLTRPIQNWLYFTEPRRAYFPKVTIIAEAGAELTYVENINAPLMHNPLFINGVTEIIVKENASVNFARIQNLEDNAFYIDNGRAKIWDEGQLYHFQANMGAGLVKTKFESKLVGQNAHAKLDGISFASQNQHVDQNTMQIHEAPYSYSNLNYHNVVTDEAHTVYRGMIRVEENAHKIDAYQKNKNLVLSDNAKADSIPGLEILTDDLSCSHGSTVGQIDQEQLYYLLSRGIKEEDAKQLIVAGFLDNIVQNLPDENMKLLISDIIEGKILKELRSHNE